jgi:putative nucleotidyltransferase with HDIG domain
MEEHRGLEGKREVIDGWESRERALALVRRYTANERLVKHMLAVEAAMKHYARVFGENERYWGQVGLLHDFDYEKYPDEHPMKGAEILRAEGYPEPLIQDILSHFEERSGVPRDSLVRRALFACDELTGFLVAVALVMPSKKLEEVTVDRVVAKMKDKGFARAVSREDIRAGADSLGLTLEEHIQNVLQAMQSIANDLGL